MVRFSKTEKDAIVAEIRQFCLTRFPTVETYRACLYCAIGTVIVLRHRGLDAMIQAGTCCWPRIRPEQDDGFTPTHYSFVWEPNTPQSILAVVAGNLPEMHVWVVIRGSWELVDVTTGSIPQHALINGLDWPGDLPPDYFWDSNLPDGVIYSANMDACELALKFANEILR